MNRLAILAAMSTLTMTASAQITSSSLSDACQKVTSALKANGKWDERRPQDIYLAGQCNGFIQGWIEGIDGAILTRNNGYVTVQVKRSQIKDSWDIATALVKDMREQPLDSGKPADDVLSGILLSSGLLTLTPQFLSSGSQGDALHSTASPQ